MVEGLYKQRAPLKKGGENCNSYKYSFNSSESNPITHNFHVKCDTMMTNLFQKGADFKLFGQRALGNRYCTSNTVQQALRYELRMRMSSPVARVQFLPEGPSYRIECGNTVP